MRRSLANPWLALAVTAGACWDSWLWYAGRVAGTPEEALALVLTIALVLALGLQRRREFRSVCDAVYPRISRPYMTERELGPCPVGSLQTVAETTETAEPTIPLRPVAVMLAAYALAQAVAPDIVVAAIAVTAVLHLLYRALLGHAPPLAFYGLVALSLPVLPSLQFVLGYPMRIASAAIAVALLELQGLAIAREGTLLVWSGATIEFDAPCSGVKMLWVGMMLTLAACVAWRSGPAMTLAAVAASLGLTLAANVIRAVSLFYVEAGLVAGAAPWWHEAIGLVAFALAALATMGLLARLNAWERHAWAR